MTSAPSSDPNELSAYGHLARLQAGDLAERVNARAQQTFLRAVDVALALPSGDARQAVLAALNSGVGATLRAHESALALDETRAALKADRPEMAEALRTHATLGAMLNGIRMRLRDTFARERAAGRDPDATSFFVFSHDLYGYLDGVRAESAKLLRVGRPDDAPPHEDGAGAEDTPGG